MYATLKNANGYGDTYKVLKEGKTFGRVLKVIENTQWERDKGGVYLIGFDVDLDGNHNRKNVLIHWCGTEAVEKALKHYPLERLKLFYGEDLVVKNSGSNLKKFTKKGVKSC